MNGIVGAESKGGPKMEGQRVSLGCGTLILIALIVLIFSDTGTPPDMAPILQRLDKIEDRLTHSASEIEDIQQELARQRRPG